MLIPLLRERERCMRNRIHTSSALSPDERKGGRKEERKGGRKEKRKGGREEKRKGGRENLTLKSHSGQASWSNLGDVKELFWGLCCK